MKISNLGVDAVKLHFVPCSLKDLAKKWLYSLEAGSISSWDNFIKAFLKKFYPVHKTAQIRKSILQFKQTANEPFWKYFERFKYLLAQCPHQATLSSSLWWIRIPNENPIRIHVPRRIFEKNEDEEWLLYEDLADKTIQWELISEKFRTNDSSSSKGGAHSIEVNIATEAKLATVMRRLKGL